MSAATLEKTQAPISAPVEPSMPTVLTVDDEPSVLSALRRLFRLHGYKTLQASSGAEGLKLLKSSHVDLVISDMRMPEMDGARFLELVRGHDESISRVLLTGYADISATIAAINLGAIHRYIAKPWDDQELLLVVREALARQDLERRNVELTALTKLQNEQLREANQELESRVAARTSELQQLNGMLEASYDELDNTFLLAFNVFSSLLEMRERVPGHSRKVAEIARATAVRLGLPQRDTRDVYLGALVHDVGKLGFPDSMLGKPMSAYTPEETVRYRRHSVDGEVAMMPLTQLQGVARIVRQHHERMDGKGFPDGLRGNQISIGARIVAAASDLEDLMDGSVGDEHFSVERARQAVKSCSGTRYDPDVIEAMLQVLAEADQAARADVCIDANELRPGMVLATDLVSARGAILLAAGYVFDERIVRQVSDFCKREGTRLTLRVRRESVPPDTPVIANPSSSSQP
jgi:response regulator RpfG family c-di-GMP phosphodiesterase